MKGEQVFGRPTVVSRAADRLLGAELQLPRPGRFRREKTIPQLRVLPPPELPACKSWVMLEMRQRARYELCQDAIFLILSLSGAAAISCAFFAAWP